MADVTTVTGIGDPSFNYFRDRVYNNPGLGCHRLNDSKDAGRRGVRGRGRGRGRDETPGSGEKWVGGTTIQRKEHRRLRNGIQALSQAL